MPDSPEPKTSLSDMLDVLRHRHRRRLLVALSEANPRKRDEVASKNIADGNDRERLGQELYHVHLPKLDAIEFVDWDRETDSITRGPRFDEIRPFLELMSAHEDVLPGDWP